MKVLTTGPRGVCTGNRLAAVASRTQNRSPSPPMWPSAGTLNGNTAAEAAVSPKAVATTAETKMRTDRVKARQPARGGEGR